MKKQISVLLLGAFLSIIGMATVNAQTVKVDTLTAKQKAIVPIGAFTASGDLSKLKNALNDGLDAGLNIEEIKEMLVQLYAYCGFPRSLNALNTFMQVLDERKAKGIKDETGKIAQPMPQNINKNEYGMKVRQNLFGRTSEPPASGYQLFAPVIDDFLKEHLFADIFYRNTLSYQYREILTISALSNMPGANPQLLSHIKATMINGLNTAQMQEIAQVIKEKVGKVQADNFDSMLSEALR